MCAQINPSLPTLGGARGDGETNLRADVVAILNELNGNLDSSNIKDGTLRTADLDSAGTVTALPSGYDGQEINYLADATNGVVWRLKYRAASASAFKWESVGAPAPLYVSSATAIANPAGVAVAPSIILPLAGDYYVDHGSYFNNNGAAASGNVGASLTVDGTTNISDTNILFEFGNVGAGVGSGAAVSRGTRINGMAASANLRQRFTAVGGLTQTRWMSVRPVRVG
jgi:hypothetical protein